jgi:hypothetical protein
MVMVRDAATEVDAVLSTSERRNEHERLLLSREEERRKAKAHWIGSRTLMNARRPERSEDVECKVSACFFE